MNQEQLTELIESLRCELAKDYVIDEKEHSFTSKPPNQIKLWIHDANIYRKYEYEVKTEVEYLGKLGSYCVALGTSTQEQQNQMAALDLQLVRETTLNKKMYKFLERSPKISIDPLGDSGKSKIVIKAKIMTLEAIIESNQLNSL